MHSAEKMEQKDNRLRCSRRPEALTRIGEGVTAARPGGWPVNVSDGFEERKTGLAAEGGDSIPPPRKGLLEPGQASQRRPRRRRLGTFEQAPPAVMNIATDLMPLS